MAGTSRVTVRIADLPDVLMNLRCEMARLLRAEAESETSSYVRSRLFEIADAYEAGLSAQARRELG